MSETTRITIKEGGERSSIRVPIHEASRISDTVTTLWIEMALVEFRCPRVESNATSKQKELFIRLRDNTLQSIPARQKRIAIRLLESIERVSVDAIKSDLEAYRAERLRDVMIPGSEVQTP
mgnify:FL=1|tara:strand:- start:333 stop:695 length:363 start_codon:yes stop_codon:yes gene_type:complete